MDAVDQSRTIIGEDQPEQSVPDATEPPPPPLPVSSRRGSKYRGYTEEDVIAATHAIAEEGLSLRQASTKYGVPKTTLAERLGDKRPRMPPKKSDEAKPTTTRYAWSETDMEKALTAIEQGAVSSISEAARRFGIPASTLTARRRGRTPRDLKGEWTRLTLQQESLLADWASAQSKLGVPPHKDELFSLAERVLQKQGVARRLGKQWIQQWMRRYPNIEILDWKKPEKPAKSAKPTDTNTYPPHPFEIVDETPAAQSSS